MLARLFGASSAAALVILAIVAVAGKPILVLVGGHSFSDAGPLLLWLAAAGCVALATVSFEPVLMAVHRAGTAMVARTAAVVVLLVTTTTLQPHRSAEHTSELQSLMRISYAIICSKKKHDTTRPKLHINTMLP